MRGLFGAVVSKIGARAMTNTLRYRSRARLTGRLVFLAQLALQDFANGGTWQAGHNVEAAQALSFSYSRIDPEP